MTAQTYRDCCAPDPTPANPDRYVDPEARAVGERSTPQMARTPTTPLTLTEAAARLGVHYMTAYKYVRTGRLAATKAGQEWMVLPADVAAFEREQRGPAGRRPRRRAYPAELRDRLIQSDEAGAWSIVERALESGMDPERVLLDLVSPAMTLVGDDWETGAITVADEHQASATAMRLISRLGPRFARRGRTRGRVVVGAVPLDEHALPTAMLRDLLRGRGLAVTDLGANVPAESWASTVHDASTEAPALRSVGMCSTSPDNDDAVAAAIEAVRKVTGVPIVLGGHAVTSRAHARALGADEYSATALDAVTLLDRPTPAPST